MHLAEELDGYAGLGGFAQAEQIRLWKEYIDWEKSNPQRLDGNTVAQRVSLAYEQALMPLMHCPEVGLLFSLKSRIYPEQACNSPMGRATPLVTI